MSLISNQRRFAGGTRVLAGPLGALLLPLFFLSVSGAQTPPAEAPSSSPPASTDAKPPPPPAWSKPALEALEASKKNDFKTAYEIATKGAGQEDKDCVFFLGRMVENGWGAKQDPVKAVEYYHQASDAGQLEAKANWARCLELGIGGKPDPERADFLWQQAAEAGFPTAQSRMGNLELNGIRRPVNETAAKDWFEKAAAQSDPEALFRMSLCYQNGWAGVAKDVPKAVECALKAANGGNLDAVNQVGMFYQHGFGLRQDKVAATGWFNFAADYGHAAAMSNLGQCYETGQGVKPNPETAAKLFAAAAKQNDAVGCLCLARCFIDGRGVAKNPAFAFVNLTRAVELGLKGAEKQRDEIKAGLSPKQLREAETLLKQIADANAKASAKEK